MSHEGALTAGQVEFLAEDEIVTIFPNIKMPRFNFIRGEVGPLQPGVPVKVPLWLALVLKKRRKCKIQPPHWMDPAFLDDAFERESHDAGAFEAVPAHFLPAALLLLDHAPDDFPAAPLIRATLEDIWNLRASKVRDGLRTIGAETSGIIMNNLSLMEINKVRPFIKRAMDQFYQLSLKGEPADQ